MAACWLHNMMFSGASFHIALYVCVCGHPYQGVWPLQCPCTVTALSFGVVPDRAGLRTPQGAADRVQLAAAAGPEAPLAEGG